jgi:TolB-like protein/tetratricopeptide (TPR) repeat protein
MKRCAECGRDYNDDSLSFCLDDGTELLFGPSSMDDPATAILHTTDAVAESPTRAQIHTTGQSTLASNEVTPSAISLTHQRNNSIARMIVILLAIALGVGGYWLYGRGSSSDLESIAVMPFVNESGNADTEYLSDGMTETLIKSLSNLPNLDVKPRSAVFRYKGKDTNLQTIGKELNVQAILNGRVIQRGDQLTLSLELVDVQKNRVIWTEQYQRKQSELVSLQSDIAKDVSTKLAPKLSGSEETRVTKAATSNPEAYQAYLKGRYYWNRRTGENVKKAIEQFKFATDRDPNYALAFTGLGDCYTVLSEYAGIPSSETVPQAKLYADRAIAIDPQLAEPHATLGSVYRQSWQWADAEMEYKRAIELNPNYPTLYHWYSILLKEMKRRDEAATAIKHARELDPLSSVIGVNLAELYQQQHNYEASIETCLKVLELDPNYGGAYEDLAVAYSVEGRHSEATAAADKAAELSKSAAVTLSTQGYVYAAAGKREAATTIIKTLEDKYGRKEAIGQDIAAVYVGLGDKDKALSWLEKDFEARDGKLATTRWFIAFESLWEDVRFKDLVKRMGLPE